MAGEWASGDPYNTICIDLSSNVKREVDDRHHEGGAESRARGAIGFGPPRADPGRVSRRSGLLPTIAAKSMFRNTIPETREPHRLCNGGLLFTSLGAGLGVGAVFIIPRLRSRLSPERLTLYANLLLILVYALMAFVCQTEAFFAVAALASVGWTMSASELWVAAQPCDAMLGARPLERRGNHDFPRGMALWGNDLGFGCGNSRNTFTPCSERRFFSSRACFWPVGFRSTLQETSKKGFPASYQFVSIQTR
jgi:hypothetical protein